MTHMLRFPWSGARRARRLAPPRAPRSHGRVSSPAVVVAAAVLVCAAAAPPASAEHRARLSADLAQGLAAGAQAIDVIVHGDAASVNALARRYNVPIKRLMKSGGVLRVNAGQLDALQRDPEVDHLSGDVPVRPAMTVTNTAIGADQVWAGAGALRALTGRGIGVAIVDSGIDTRHPALAGRVVVSVDFTGGDGSDPFGHGTHVAGIVAGQPGPTPDTREIQGVAAGAHLINLRVLDETGSGRVSDVVDAIDWAIEHRRQYRIDVLNLSLGAAVLQPYRDDPLCEAVERAVAAGLVVVASAGNFGRTRDGRVVFGGITSPGNDPYVLTVGAVDTHGTAVRSDDTVAPFSSRGPTLFDGLVKPDVVAPGVHIVSAEASGSYLARTYPERHVAGSGAAGYFQLSGTSMAAAVVSGAAALLLEENHRLTPAGVKAALELTSSFLPAAGLLGGGAGSVNALAAADLASPRGGAVASVQIAGEIVAPSWTDNGARIPALAVTPVSSALERDAIIWGVTNLDPTVWGTARPDCIIWGNLYRDSIIWSGFRDSIVWSGSESIIWSD